MTNTKWRNIAELVGIAAIVASLIFVGIETRNSTKQAALTTQALEISAYQELISNINDLNSLVIENPELGAISDKASINLDDLSLGERRSLYNFLWINWRHGDMAFFQYERGAIDEVRLWSALGPLRNRLQYSYARDHWLEAQRNFVAPYRDYVNNMIAEIGDAKLSPKAQKN